MNCIVEVVSLIEKDDDCETLAVDAKFCPAATACEETCGANGCKQKGDDLEKCAEEHYPDATEGEEGCPGLCDKATASLYEIA